MVLLFCSPFVSITSSASSHTFTDSIQILWLWVVLAFHRMLCPHFCFKWFVCFWFYYLVALFSFKCQLFWNIIHKPKNALFSSIYFSVFSTLTKFSNCLISEYFLCLFLWLVLCSFHCHLSRICCNQFELTVSLTPDLFSSHAPQIIFVNRYLLKHC